MTRPKCNANGLYLDNNAAREEYIDRPPQSHGQERGLFYFNRQYLGARVGKARASRNKLPDVV